MKLLVVCVGFLGVIAPSLSAAPDAAPPPIHETVVLLHGLGRSHLSMTRLAHTLRREGYHVVNATYPSRTRPLEELATEWLPKLLAKSTAGAARVHFVTHSMGGILVRLWLSECGAPANLGRVVMLAPPNAGSEIPDRLATFPPFRWMTGVNGVRLSTASDALPRALGPWPCDAGELGVIAGNRAWNPVLNACVPRPHDGKVSVASTHLEGESDHVVLASSHTWLGWQRDALEHVSAFLRHGRFAAHAEP
jgi:pimeloyl-ACP methyl ester carboxylesterase